MEATRRAITEETDRSTGTVGRLRCRVEKILAETAQGDDQPTMPSERTFYRLVNAWPRAGTLKLGTHPPLAGQAAGGAVRRGYGRASGRGSIPPRWMCGWSTTTGPWTGSS